MKVTGRLKYGLLAVVALALAFTSCEKEVKINFKGSDPKVVVEGAIEYGLPPYVILTHSIGYFERINPDVLQNSYLHGAKISVTDGMRSVALKEYIIDTPIGGTNYKFSIYSVDVTDPDALQFTGQYEKFYTLNIKTEDGQEFSAVTKIPQPKPVDSMWVQAPPSPPKPGAVQLFVQYSDPDTIGNCVKYWTQRRFQAYDSLTGQLKYYNTGFVAGLNSSYNDEIINGSSIRIVLDAGYDRSNPDLNLDTYGYFFRGDTIVLKWSAIDRATYDFWSTLDFAYSSTGNPFASPVQILGNLKGGALGVWAGYGTTYDTLIVPK
jgi:hypothetical protein